MFGNNRFKCLIEEYDNKSHVYTNKRNSNSNSNSNSNVRPNRNYNMNLFNSNSNFKKQETIIENDEENFPSLDSNKQNIKDTNTNTNTNTNTISYGSIVKNEEKIPKKKKKKNELKKGWIQLAVKEEQQDNDIQCPYTLQDEYLFFIDCMVNLYEHQKTEKIEILGEEIYESIFKFPNYDYKYFDKLDEQYELDIENELRKYNNDLYYSGYKSDNSM
jgi:hypothetical protein